MCRMTRQRARRYRVCCRVHETPSPGRGRRFGARRARGACGRVARAGASCRPRDASGGVAGAGRPACRAAARGPARACRRSTGRGSGCAAGAHRVAGDARGARRDAAPPCPGRSRRSRLSWPSRSGSSSSVRRTPASASTLRSRRLARCPEPTGEATLTKTSSGWRIELDATGLPRLEGGRFYQAWLRNAAGVLVPIGTFNEGEDVTLVGGGVAEGLHDADRHPRGGRRRAGLVGREGARRNRRRALIVRARCLRCGAPLVGAPGRADS